MIEARQLTRRFQGRGGVQDVSLSVDPGEIFALLGGNGAGKSTLIKVFLGFLEPESGLATVDGAPPASARGRIGYIPENVAIYPELTGIENLRFFARLSGKSLGVSEARDMLGSLGLPNGSPEARASTYSKGMRQKVGIAIALSRGAGALLLDEPLSGLDPSSAHEFSEKLREVRAQNCAVLMATHDLFRAKAVADRIGVMRDGRLVETIDPSDLDPSSLESLYLRHMSAA